MTLKISKALIDSSQPVKADGALQSLIDKIDKIADIAHCGGLTGLTQGEALIAIRKLTIGHWRKDRDEGQMKIDVRKATIAASTAWGLP